MTHEEVDSGFLVLLWYAHIDEASDPMCCDYYVRPMGGASKSI